MDLSVGVFINICCLIALRPRPSRLASAMSCWSHGMLDHPPEMWGLCLCSSSHRSALLQEVASSLVGNQGGWVVPTLGSTNCFRLTFQGPGLGAQAGGQIMTSFLVYSGWPACECVRCVRVVKTQAVLCSCEPPCPFP